MEKVTPRMQWERARQHRAPGRGGVPLWLVLAAALMAGGGGAWLLAETGADRWLSSHDLGITLPGQVRPADPAISLQFALCSGAVRSTCVVDGDTIWLRGTKIRMADINTPELGQPACAAEAALGRQATQRLADLLNAGPFEVQTSGDRDQDQYGRKLRVLVRDGVSLGDTLVDEGLAHPWGGRRESWC